MDDGGRLWTIMGFYAGLRAVCVAREGLTGFFGKMPDFTAQCQTFDHFFGFCRAVVGGGFFCRGMLRITRRRIVKSQKKRRCNSVASPLKRLCGIYFFSIKNPLLIRSASVSSFDVVRIVEPSYILHRSASSRITKPTLHVVGVFIPRRKTEQEFQHDIPHSQYANQEHKL